MISLHLNLRLKKPLFMSSRKKKKRKKKKCDKGSDLSSSKVAFKQNPAILNNLCISMTRCLYSNYIFFSFALSFVLFLPWCEFPHIPAVPSKGKT